jgi:hypothetical protein
LEGKPDGDSGQKTNDDSDVADAEQRLSEHNIKLATKFRDPLAARAKFALFNRIKRLHDPELECVFEECDTLAGWLGPDFRKHVIDLLASVIGPGRDREFKGDPLLFTSEAYEAVLFVLAWDSDPDLREVDQGASS